MMIKRFLTIAAVLLVSVATWAQTAAEISAAKALARSYGYSEAEISNIVKQQSPAAPAKAVAAPAPVSETPAMVNIVTNGKVGEDVVPEVPAAPTAANEAKDDEDQIYGHSFFRSTGLGIIPSYNAPAPASYVLGPGDEIVLDIWGATMSHMTATISNDGSINIDGYGPAYISGMSIADAENALKAELSRIYSGLADGRGDTSLKLTLGKIKGVVVNVAGEVVTAGAYTIPSLSSIPSLIYMAGGITERGSVRNIGLFRKGKKVANFDLYDFIFNGKYDANLRLQDGDVVSVEPYSNVVFARGAFMRDMRYEMKEGETVSDLISYAGGFASQAMRDEINVVRRGEDGGSSFNVKAFDFGSFKLKDVDIISARRYTNRYRNGVTISGPVKYPGTYAIDDNVKDVASLVKAAGGVEDGAYMGRGQIKRLDESLKQEFLSFNLGDVIAGKSYIPLMRADSVTLFRSNDLLESRSVSINGHVLAPGTYTYYDGMTVADLILMAKGLREYVYGVRGHILRVEKDGVQTIVSFDVEEAMKGNGNVALIRDDAVRIYSMREFQDNATVTVAGNVNNPDTFTYREGMTLEDAFLMAHGFANGADLSNIEVSSRGGRERGSVQIVNLEESKDGMMLALKPYDVISVRRLTYFRPQVTVTVAGEVMSPGPYTLDKPVVRISDVMAKTGGFTESAYVHGARLIRRLTQAELVKQRKAVELANRSLDENAQIDDSSLEQTYDVGIDLEKAVKNPGSLDDVALRDGDVIRIPQINNTVKVSGGVFYPNIVAFSKSLSWRGYVKQAGGFTKNARKNKTYAVYMNGKVAVAGQIVPEPGMEIIVPEAPEMERQPVSVAEIAAMASSTTSIATMVATLVNMFKK